MIRRIIALTILIVVLSTLLNFAIALGFWWFGERLPSDIMMYDPRIVDPRPLDLAVWRHRRGAVWPEEPEVASRHNYMGVTFRSMVWSEREWSGPMEDAASKITNLDSYSIDVLESGWPMRCLAGERWIERHGLTTLPQVTSGMLVALGGPIACYGPA